MRSWRPLPSLFLLLSLSLGWIDPAGADRAPTRTISCTFQFHVSKQKDAQASLTVLVPRTLPGRQKILRLTYSPRPDKVFDDHGNRYARFVVDPERSSLSIAVTAKIEIYRHDLATVSARDDDEKKETAEALKPWLAEERYIETGAAEIQRAATKVAGESELATLRKIMAFVGKTLRYSGYNPKDVGALQALKRKHGDCTEFSDLFVALCRARHIPARVWEGYLATGVGKDDTFKHNWVEVYTKRYGWVAFDPLHVAQDQTAFERLRVPYIYLSPLRNDTQLQGYHFFFYRSTGQNTRVRDSFRVNK